MPQVQYSFHFENYTAGITETEQRQIVKFIMTFQKYGLGNFDNYEGKVGPSWKVDDEEVHEYAKQNNLWHAHVGYPEFSQVHNKYKTSDYVVHFIWDKYNTYNTIKLIDYTPHKIDGKFPIPEEYKFV